VECQSSGAKKEERAQRLTSNFCRTQKAPRVCCRRRERILHFGGGKKKRGVVGGQVVAVGVLPPRECVYSTVSSGGQSPRSLAGGLLLWDEDNSKRLVSRRTQMRFGGSSPLLHTHRESARCPRRRRESDGSPGVRSAWGDARMTASKGANDQFAGGRRRRRLKLPFERVSLRRSR